MQNYRNANSQDTEAEAIMLNIARTMRVDQREFDLLVSYIRHLQRLATSSQKTV
ncbi:MAG: hypothetical protein OXC95_08150 [Dehalococcoidia bacterium]|nr:hypothetical protein [Dehalococcoidia bacterium]